MTQAKTWPSWREATERALYAPNGFYRRDRSTEHYRTSVGASSHYAAAMVTLLRDVDAMLDCPPYLDVVDIGSGTGRLLVDMAAQCPDELRARLRLTGVDLGPRPDDLAPEITWTTEVPSGVTGLIVANEWLDNVPLDVAEQTPSGPRLLLVDPLSGEECVGGPPSAEDLAWLDRWWPLREVGERAEIGWPRDQAWAEAIRRLARGVAITADYSHERADRPVYGTLIGYRNGRVVEPVPDGSCDVTAHVALDACAAAGVAAGATHTVLTTQRDALRALGLTANRPPVVLAHDDPSAYLRELRRAGEEAELIDRAGLGAFGWLAQAVGTSLPSRLEL